MINFSGKVVLITGAVQGIGLAAAKEFALAGAKVLVVDKNKDKGVKAVAAIRASGGEAHFFGADLRLEKDIRGMVRCAVSRWGRLDVLVNNARPPLGLKPFRDSFKEWDLAMDVMLKAPALAAKHAQPFLERPIRVNY